MRIPILLPILITVPLLCACSIIPAPAAPEGITITLDVNPTVISADRDATLNIHLENRGQAHITIWQTQFPFDNFDVQVFDAAKHEIPLTLTGQRAHTSLVSGPIWTDLVPGGKEDFHLSLHENFQIAAPGTYAIIAAGSFQVPGVPKFVRAVSAPATLTVLPAATRPAIAPANTPAAGEVVSESAAAFLDPNVTSLAKVVVDKEFQQSLNRIATLLQPVEGRSSDMISAYKELLALEDHERFHAPYRTLRQALYYRWNPAKPGGNIYQFATPGWVLRELDIGRDPFAVLQAIAPFADSDDPATKTIVEEFLDIVELSVWGDPMQSRDASGYQLFLQSCFSEKVPLPKAVILKMFERQPTRGLLTCERAYIAQPNDREPIANAAHTLDNYLWQKAFDKKYHHETPVDPAVRTTLADLAQDPNWWPRAFVAEILGQYPELRAAALVKKLQTDDHEVVKAILAKFKWEQ